MHVKLVYKLIYVLYAVQTALKCYLQFTVVFVAIFIALFNINARMPEVYQIIIFYVKNSTANYDTFRIYKTYEDNKQSIYVQSVRSDVSPSAVPVILLTPVFRRVTHSTLTSEISAF